MYTNQVGILPVTIAEGGTLSDEVNLQDSALIGVIMDADWTAAVLAFQLCYESTGLLPCYDQTGQEITVEAAAGRIILLAPSLFPGVTKIKVQSGATGATVAQAAARTLKLIYRKVS